MSDPTRRRCLVLGARGFLGGHVMVAGERFARELGAELMASPDSLDIRDAAALREFVRAQAPDYVVHLAAVSFAPDSTVDSAATYQTNFIGTLHLLAALAETGFAGTLLFPSSAAVYGSVPESELPVRETRAFAPRTPYAVSKAGGELLCTQHVLARKLDVRIARPFNVIGAGQSSKFAVSSFAKQIADLERAGGGTISVGNLDVTRDFVDVNDAVAAFVAILRAGRPGEAYNICSGKEVLLSALLERLTAIARVPIEIAIDPARVRPAEQRRLQGSHEKLARATGWRPGVTLDTSLCAVLEYWRSAPAGGASTRTSS